MLHQVDVSGNKHPKAEAGLTGVLEDEELVKVHGFEVLALVSKPVQASRRTTVGPGL